MIKFFKELPLQAIFGLGFLLLIFTSGLAVYKLSEQKEFLILHFDPYRGIDMFGDIRVVYQILGMSAIVFVINFFLASSMFNRERFFSYIIGFGTLLFSVLLLIGISVIILVN